MPRIGRGAQIIYFACHPSGGERPHGQAVVDEDFAELLGLGDKVVWVRGNADRVFCHATPHDDQEAVVVDSRLERWAEVLGDLPPEVEMRRAAYDPVAACAQVTGSSSYPDVAKWTDYFLHAPPTSTPWPSWLPAMARLASDRQLMSNSLPSGSRMATP